MGTFRHFFLTLAVALLPAMGLFCAEQQSSDPKSYRIGNPQSDKEVFLFTNWHCHHCQQLEPSLEGFLPKMMENSPVNFVDLTFEGGDNFARYNLGYLLKNKSDYLKIRPILDRMSKTNPSATPEEIAAELKKNHIEVTPLDDATFKQLRANFKALLPQMDVKTTPTLVIIDRRTGQKNKLGGEQITETNVMEALTR